MRLRDLEKAGPDWFNDKYKTRYRKNLMFGRDNDAVLRQLRSKNTSGKINSRE